LSISTGKRGVIVIGSKPFSGVTCYKWGEFLPNIAEYDTAILNITSGYEKLIIQELCISVKSMLNNLRESNGEIYFIIDEKSNLEWDSFCLDIELEEGFTVQSDNFFRWALDGNTSNTNS